MAGHVTSLPPLFRVSWNAATLISYVYIKEGTSHTISRSFLPYLTPCPLRRPNPSLPSSRSSFTFDIIMKFTTIFALAAFALGVAARPRPQDEGVPGGEDPPVIPPIM